MTNFGNRTTRIRRGAAIGAAAIGAAAIAGAALVSAGPIVGRHLDSDPPTPDWVTVVTLTVDVARGLPLCDENDSPPAGWTGGCIFRSQP